MSTEVLATYILGVATDPTPGHPLRTDYDMELWEYINSGLRLRTKLREVYWEGPSRDFGPPTPSLYGGNEVPNNDEINIVTLNGVQVGMIKDPISFYHTVPTTPHVPYATIVSFVELLGPETSPNPKLTVQAVTALMRDASKAFARRFSEDRTPFRTLKDGNPFDRESIIAHRFQWDWKRFQTTEPQSLGPSPLSGPPLTAESIARTASDSTLVSDSDLPPTNSLNPPANNTSRPTPRLYGFDPTFGNPYGSRPLIDLTSARRRFPHANNAAPIAPSTAVPVVPVPTPTVHTRRIRGQPGRAVAVSLRRPASQTTTTRAFQLPTPLGVTAMVAGTILAMELYRYC